jgi:flagellar basal body rod protein FlgB
MNTQPLTTDNIDDLLVKIIEFTLSRQKIIVENIKNSQQDNFVPKDLAVDEFCGQMMIAISEHISSHRLVYCDTESIKFGTGGSFEALPAVDECAKELLDEDADEYFRQQMNKLQENLINQRIATELLRERLGMVPVLE